MGSKMTVKKTNATSGGGTYKVGSDGKAPTGLSAGDSVVTGGGTYKITGVNADGSYQSTKVNNTTTSNYSGSYSNAPSTGTSVNNQYTGTAPSGFTGSANAVVTYTPEQTAAKSKMNANSQEWWTATPERQKELEAENKALNNQYFDGGLTLEKGYWSGAGEKPTEQSGFSYSGSQPSFGNTYGARIDEMLNQILSREDFSYNPETDQLFQYYRDMYQREGDRAMQNTLAEVAAGAGGMNSYAITAAQQANNYYNAQMTDKIPELYRLAYQMYLDDKASQVENLGLLQQMDTTQYNRYRDTMNDFYTDRDFAYGVYRDDVADKRWETEFNYGASRDQVSDNRYNQEFEYNAGRDQIADNRYETEAAYDRALDLIAAGVVPDVALLQKAGLTETQARQMLTQATTKQTKSSGNKDGDGGGGQLKPNMEQYEKYYRRTVDILDTKGKNAAYEHLSSLWERGILDEDTALYMIEKLGLLS
ncbi:MAG: hypothetical protein E7471_06345 [Ruminococcaceae bacterium]|nr:hypothetical protein [Oscillospiraceae bacterium]